MHTLRREKLISLEEAQGLVLEAAAPLGTVVVPLKNASGRVLAEEVRSSHDEPALPQAAMDGYALCSAELEMASPERDVFLSVVGEVCTGHKERIVVKEGEAVRIMTGASLPEGADAVVPQEMTAAFDNGIRLMTPVAPGDYLLPAGAEFQRGQLFLSRGRLLQAREITLLAALGREKVLVRRQPAVAVLATGSELLDVGEKLSPGHVFASNLHMVEHLVNRCGGKAASLETAGDNLRILMSAIQSGTEADVVVTTGGTGAGEKDLITAAVAKLGGELFFQGVGMTPGKQTIFAKLGDTLLFGLPGRPAAAYVAFEQLVRPALLHMLRIPRVFLPEVSAALRHGLGGKGEIPSFVFCRIIFGPDGPLAEGLRSKTKGMFAEMLAANGLLRVDPGRKCLQSGESVRVLLLDIALEGLSYFAES